MRTVLLNLTLAAAWLLGSIGIAVPVRGQSSPELDFSYAEFTAPALAGACCGGFPANWPHGAIPMNHAHFLYAGYQGSAPPGEDLWYSYGITGPNSAVSGYLDSETGSCTSTIVTLARPPSEFPTPYHLLPLALPQNGGLLIGSAPHAPWAGRDFQSIFPGLDLAAVISQVRSDNLEGGPVESLLRWMLQQGVTGTSPVPINQILPLPEVFPAGPVWGFSETGAPLDLSLTFRYYTHPGDPDSTYPRTEYAFWRLTGPDYLVIPEARSGKSLLLGLPVLAAGMGWRRVSLRRRRSA